MRQATASINITSKQLQYRTKQANCVLPHYLSPSSCAPDHDWPLGYRYYHNYCCNLRPPPPPPTTTSHRSPPSRGRRKGYFYHRQYYCCCRHFREHRHRIQKSSCFRHPNRGSRPGQVNRLRETGKLCACQASWALRNGCLRKTKIQGGPLQSCCRATNSYLSINPLYANGALPQKVVKRSFRGTHGL